MPLVALKSRPLHFSVKLFPLINIIVSIFAESLRIVVIMYFLNNNHLIIKALITRCYVSPSDMTVRDRINEPLRLFPNWILLIVPLIKRFRLTWIILYYDNYINLKLFSYIGDLRCAILRMRQVL